MAYIIISERSGRKAYYLQFFDGDPKFPIREGTANEIRSGYALNMAEGNTKEKNGEAKFEIGEAQSLFSIDVTGGEEKYVLRFSEGGKGITIDPDLAYYLQSTCRLEPEAESHKKGVKAYRIKPKGTACIKKG